MQPPRSTGIRPTLAEPLALAVPAFRGRDGRRRARLDDFGALLSERVGIAVVAAEVDTYSEILARLGADVNLAWMAPALAVRAVYERRATLLVSACRAPGAHYRGAMFVRDRAPFDALEELRGARVAWVDAHSCSGYLFPRMTLALRGFDPDRFFAEQLVLGSHAAVARAVADGRVDVGATFVNIDAGEHATRAVRAGWEDATDEAMRAIVLTDDIPADAIVAAEPVDRATRSRLVEVLAALHESPRGAAVMRDLFEAARLEPTNDRRYASVRAALGPGT